MTYEEWSAVAKVWPPFSKEIYEAGAASRDAEIAELVAALDNSIFVFDLDPKIAKALAKVRKP